MAQNISPGVYVIEKDVSQFLSGEDTSIVGIVGFADKGPVNTPTLVTSREELIRVFGKPSENIPSQAIEAGLEIMEIGNQIYFVRAAVDALVADSEVVIPFGACPAVQVSAGNFGVSNSLYLKVQVTDNTGASKFTTPKLFSIPSGTADTQTSAMLSVIGGAADQDYVSFETFDNKSCIVGMFPGQNASISVSAYSDAACTVPIVNAISPVFYKDASLSTYNLPGVIKSASGYTTLNTSNAFTFAATSAMIVSSFNSAAVTGVGTTVNFDIGTSSFAQIRIAINTACTSGGTPVSAGADFTYDPDQGKYFLMFYNTPNATTTIGDHMHDPAVSSVHVGSGAGVSVSGPAAFLLGFTSANTYQKNASGSTGNAYNTTASSMTAYGATLDLSSLTYKVQSLYAGTGYDYTQNSDGSYSGNAVNIALAAKDKNILTVTDDGVSSESYKVGLDDSVFYESVINTGLTDAVSEYIKANLVTGSTYDTDIDAIALDDGFLSPLSAIGVDASTLNYTTGGFQAGFHPYPYTAGTTILPARFIHASGSVAATGTNSKFRFNKLVDGTYPLANGANGYSTSDQSVNDQALIGTTGESVNTGIYALDRDYFNISVAIVPGVNTQDVQNALINLAESSQNFLALVSPPYGSISNVQQAIDWSNGRSETRTAAINSSFAAVYWPWVKVYSVYDATDRWYDPVIFAARQMCYTDLISDPWIAPAGFTRGALTKPKDVEVQLTQGDRDSMYTGGNIINPIVKFPSAGITIFGQRTAKRTPSALDRINVRRLMIYLRKLIVNGTQSLVFEPNDPFTWAAVKNLIEPTLNDIKNRRGLLDYSVVCDESTNTPARVERGELWCKVVVRPTKSAEIITFELNVTNQSAKIG